MVKINNNTISEFYKSKSVLITGGSGYIGSPLLIGYQRKIVRFPALQEIKVF